MMLSGIIPHHSLAPDRLTLARCGALPNRIESWRGPDAAPASRDRRRTRSINRAATRRPATPISVLSHVRLGLRVLQMIHGGPLLRSAPQKRTVRLRPGSRPGACATARLWQRTGRIAFGSRSPDQPICSAAKRRFCTTSHGACDGRASTLTPPLPTRPGRRGRSPAMHPSA